jgi:hypothetical protein
MLVSKNKFMKKYILIVVAVLILGWLVFDKVKNVDWHINPIKVDNPPPYTRFEVFGTWGGTHFISDDYVDPPVLTAKFTLLKNNQIVFEKIEKIDTGQYGIRDYTYQIDIAKFVKPESSLHGFFKSCKDYSLYFSVFFCALEVILGFAMIIAWQMDFSEPFYSLRLTLL